MEDIHKCICSFCLNLCQNFLFICCFIVVVLLLFSSGFCFVFVFVFVLQISTMAGLADEAPPW